MNPTPEQIKTARVAAGLTQVKAAGLVHRTEYRRWSEWENGHVPMPPAEWELFCLKTGFKPVWGSKVVDIVDNKK